MHYKGAGKGKNGASSCFLEAPFCYFGVRICGLRGSDDCFFLRPFHGCREFSLSARLCRYQRDARNSVVAGTLRPVLWDEIPLLQGCCTRFVGRNAVFAGTLRPVLWDEMPYLQGL